jgi:hypothetical protein
MVLWGIEVANTCNVCQSMFFLGGIIFHEMKKMFFGDL